MAKMFNAWLEKGDTYYTYGYNHLLFIEALAHITTTNFKGLASSWWNGLSHDLHTDYTSDWPTLHKTARDHLLQLDGWKMSGVRLKKCATGSRAMKRKCQPNTY
jgi:hypothetical protein